MTQIAVRGDIDKRAIEQLTRCAEKGDAPLAAACADAHVGYSLCVGGVIGYRDFVSPSGVGYDIGCGNMAVKTNLYLDDVVGAVGQRPPGGTRAGSLKRTNGENVGPDAGSKEHRDRRSNSLRPKNEASLHAYSVCRSENIAGIMDEIVRRIDFGMGTRQGNEADHPVLEQIEAADFVPQRGLAKLARDQLGTVGSGNHYVDLFVDEDGYVWIGVHFGSRGFGHKTAMGFLAMAQEAERRAKETPSAEPGHLSRLESLFATKAAEGEMDAPPTLFHVKSELGQSYISAMKLAGAYAYAGREVVVQRVLDILGAEAIDTIHNHHNYAWRENHWVDGKRETLWVVRKGATPAFPGQRGFVGATMGEPAVILEGAAEPSSTSAQQSLLYSTVHGAGRVMSRTEAAGKTRWRWTCSNRDCDWHQGKGEHKPEDGVCPECGNTKLRKRPVHLGRGKIDWNWTLAQMDAKGIELRGAAADEAPLAYKRLDDVLDYHAGTVNVLHTLTPIGVAMAGPNTRDDYKD